MKEKQKVFIYARKSSEDADRQIDSIDHQIAELRAKAAREELDVVEEFRESRTAKIPGRPIFNEMMRRVKSGEASWILALSPDRLARNTLDGGLIIYCIDTGIIKNLRFVNSAFEPTPYGMMMLHIEFGMAKYYVDAMGQRIRMAIKQRIMAGFWPKQAPLGYLFDSETRILKLDPDRAPQIRKAFELYASGNYTIRQLAHLVNLAGLRTRATKKHPSRPVSKSRYHKLLMNPVYTGVILYKNELFEGQHTAIVPSRLFDRCQAVMLRRGYQGAPRLKQFHFRGFFTCGECGCQVTHEVQKGHVYLRCSKRKGPCSQPYLREEKAIEQVTRILARLSLHPWVGEWMIKQFQAKQKDDVSAATQQANLAKARINEFSEKEQRLTMVYVNGDLTPEAFRESKKRLVMDKQAWTEKLTFWQKNNGKRFEPAIRFVMALQRAGTVAAGENTAAKRDFLKNTGSNFKLTNGRITADFFGGWKLAWESRVFELEPPLLQESTTASTPIGSTVVPLWTSQIPVRTLSEQIEGYFRENPVVD